MCRSLVDDDALRGQIEQLESKIEDLAEIAESCRTLMMFSKGAIAVGALLLLVVVFGPVRLNPAVMIGAMAAVIGGIVVFGSNKSTLERTTIDMKSAEALRDELIGRIELRIVDR